MEITRVGEVLVLLSRPGWHLLNVDPALAGRLHRTPEEMLARPLLEFVDPGDVDEVLSGLAQLEGGSAQVRLTSRFIGRDGGVVRLPWLGRPVSGTVQPSGSGPGAGDGHRLRAERQALRAQLDLALGPVTAALWELDLRQRRFVWEPRSAEILGVGDGAEPASPEHLAAVVHPDDAAVILTSFHELAHTGAVHVEVRIGHGATVRYLSVRGKVLDRDSGAGPVRAVGLMLDVTAEKAMEEQILHMAVRDPLTAVPNRRAFEQALRGEWRRCTRGLEPLSVVMIDIDDFKRFNETFNHLVGDDALVAVARALTATLNRAGDVLARFGGDEFAVVLPGVDSTGALSVANRLIEAVRAVIVRQGGGWDLAVSAGTASWHPGSAVLKPVDLVARADEALCAAKLDGNDHAVAYELSLAARAALETAIADGLARGEFRLHYQPVIGLAAGKVVGFEALMRWDRPGHGLVPPDSFIPTAEASTLICDLGRWALREAACQLAAWPREGLTDTNDELRMAVNVSGRHVANPTVVADVIAALAAAGIAPHHLEVELTETALVDDALAGTHLAKIRALGVSVAIDDFGTGYTSVGQLPHVPADILKIDRSFVASTDPRHQALVALIVEAAHAFDLEVVAEGIEDAATLHVLRDLGCDAAQGYLIARPMPAERIVSWLAEWRASTATALLSMTPSR